LSGGQDFVNAADEIPSEGGRATWLWGRWERLEDMENSFFSPCEKFSCLLAFLYGKIALRRKTPDMVYTNSNSQRGRLRPSGGKDCTRALLDPLR